LGPIVLDAAHQASHRLGYRAGIRRDDAG
jgi:hypothetical protein